MKKFSRFILVLLVVLVAAWLILMTIEPTDMPITRTVVIKAPKEIVFEQVAHLTQWVHWSPWYRMDTAMKIDYVGTDGQQGSSYHWVGNDNVGEGTMKCTAISGTQVDFQMDFVKPMTGTAHGYMKVDDTTGMVKVTWVFAMHMGKPWNAGLAFMNMDKILGKDFENGLMNLKTYAETRASGGDVVIKEVDLAEQQYAGARKEVNWSDITRLCGATYPVVRKNMGAKIAGPSVSIYYTWDTAGKRTDMAAAFPVTDTSTPVKGISFMFLPTSKAFMAVHKGGYATMMREHEALKKYMAGKGKEMTICVEENAVSAPEEADSNKWVTNIYYLEK